MEHKRGVLKIRSALSRRSGEDSAADMPAGTIFESIGRQPGDPFLRLRGSVDVAYFVARRLDGHKSSRESRFNFTSMAQTEEQKLAARELRLAFGGANADVVSYSICRYDIARLH